MRSKTVLLAGFMTTAMTALGASCGGTVTGTGATGTGATGSGGDPSIICTPNSSRECAGIGCQGNNQVCNAQGTAWSICTCGAGAGPSSSSTSTSTSTSTSSGTGGVDGGMLASPPPAGPMMNPDGTSAVTFAMKKLYLGDTDPDGTPDKANGWKHFGYNLDGLSSSNLSAFCKTVNNASPALVHAQGINGIENSFGHNIVPILLGVNASTSTEINNAIVSGSYSALFSLDNLGSSASYNALPSHYAEGGKLGSTPHFDGTDVWPFIQGTNVDLPTAYLTSNTWVSASKATVTVTLPVMGAMLDLHLHEAVLTMNLDAAHQNATGGILAGVLSTAELQASIKTLAGTIDTSLCSGPTIDSILAQLAQASDILQDGTQDPTKTCDGITIGLGFDAATVKLGSSVPPVTHPDPCAPQDAGPG